MSKLPTLNPTSFSPVRITIILNDIIRHMTSEASRKYFTIFSTENLKKNKQNSNSIYKKLTYLQKSYFSKEREMN